VITGKFVSCNYPITSILLPDQHFKAPNSRIEFSTRTKFVAWLDEVKKDEAIFLLGDLFDFWFEYKNGRSVLSVFWKISRNSR
jgi:UDP-2,3-diacylglucosamine pyrophosphatase LpxH